MTRKELAEMLNGAQYRLADKEHLFDMACKNGLVIVHGVSNFSMQFEGAIKDAAEVCKGGVAYLTQTGLYKNVYSCDKHDCPYLHEALKKTRKIRAVWNGAGKNAPWEYETDIPHDNFDIYKDGELWCKGIVFSVKDLEDKEVKK